jgi:hypothetical protein
MGHYATVDYLFHTHLNDLQQAIDAGVASYIYDAALWSKMNASIHQAIVFSMDNILVFLWGFLGERVVFHSPRIAVIANSQDMLIGIS